VISGWLADDDCPDCGGPLLDTSTDAQLLVLDCPGCGHHATWRTDPDDHPAGPEETEDA
jgi:uncharacterized Zn finger protein (UPF0148 family)